MRRPAGWLLVVVGVGLGIIAAVAAVAFGPDDAISSGPHTFRSDGLGVATAPGALAYAGPTVEISVSSDDPAERVFVGVGQDVDVRDYLTGAPYTRIDAISVPWDTSTTEVSGPRRPETGPTGLDWWLVSDAGEGFASVRFRLPDSAVDVVAMNPDRSLGLRVDVTVSVEQEGAFVAALALGVCALGLGLCGWLLSRDREPFREAELPTQDPDKTEVAV